MKQIQLTQGQFAIVDDADFEWLSQYRWFAARRPDQRAYYAQRNVKLADGTFFTIPMHRQILGLERGDRRKGDHKNLQTLDNRRANLRIATDQQNRANGPAYSVSGFKGVYRRKSGTYQAQIRVCGKLIALGTYTNPSEAHKAYCEAAKQHFGEFARAA